MSKIIFPIYLLIFFLAALHTFAMKVEKEDDKDSGNPPSALTQIPTIQHKANHSYSLGETPPDIILTITDNLKNDLKSRLAFALTSKKYYGIIMSSSRYTSPKSSVYVLETLTDTLLKDIRFLIKFWKKGNTQQTVQFLQDIGGQFQTDKELFSRQKFELYLKSLNCLYALGSGKALDTAKELYHSIQVELEKSREIIGPDEGHILDPKKFILHSKLLSLLDAGLRGEIAESYEKGKQPFGSNPLKAEKYRKSLNLPITF